MILRISQRFVLNVNLLIGINLVKRSEDLKKFEKGDVWAGLGLE